MAQDSKLYSLLKDSYSDVRSPDIIAHHVSTRSLCYRSTTDIDSHFMDTTTIHGREYQKHAIENNIHFTPVDEEMMEQLEAQHGLFNLIFNDKLIFPPIETLHRVLDLGYGAANWAIQVAEQHPSAEVIGIDISSHMLPDELPPNFSPRISDLNCPFLSPAPSFTLINIRCLHQGISKSRWPTLIRGLTPLLQPGGWLQFTDFYPQFQSDNGSLTNTHALRRWSMRYIRSIDPPKNPRIPMALQAEFENAGLVSVESRMIAVPLCAWTEDEKTRQVGERMGELLEGWLRSMSAWVFRSRLFMGEEEFEKLIGECVAEASDRGVKGYLPLYVVVGMKAEES